MDLSGNYNFMKFIFYSAVRSRYGLEVPRTSLTIRLLGKFVSIKKRFSDGGGGGGGGGSESRLQIGLQVHPGSI